MEDHKVCNAEVTGLNPVLASKTMSLLVSTMSIVSQSLCCGLVPSMKINTIIQTDLKASGSACSLPVNGNSKKLTHFREIVVKDIC